MAAVQARPAVEIPADGVAQSPFGVGSGMKFDALAAGTAGREEKEGLVATLTQGIREGRLVELDYLKEGEETTSPHLVEPYSMVDTWPSASVTPTIRKLAS